MAYIDEGSSTYTTVATTRESKEVIEQIDILDKCVVTLAELEGALRGRLEPVLSVETEPCPPEAKDDVSLCPLAQNLRSIRRRVEDTTENIRRVLKELEL